MNGRYLAGAIGVLAAMSVSPTAQARQLRFSITTGGGIVATGNTLGLSKGIDENGPGTEDSIGTFISLDPVSTDAFPANPLNPWFPGTTEDWTQNGSSAELVLPNDVEILYAELVWGGSWFYGSENVSASLDDSVGFGFEDGDGIDVAPSPATDLTVDTVAFEGFDIHYYLRSADVTDFVAEHGAGFYETTGVPATQDSLIDELNAAGWSLIVVYRNGAEPIRNLTVFVGGAFVDEESTVDYDFAGFCTPPSGAFEGYAVVSALEGDADREGDSLTIAPDLGGPFTPLMGPNNPEQNFFCSQINDFTGELDTAGSFGLDNHNAQLASNALAGRQGWDVTTVPVSSAAGHLDNDQTAAVLRTETSGDSYLPVAAAFAIEVNAPDFTGASADVDPGALAVDQTATVTVDLENVGLVDANNLQFFAPLPDGLVLDGFFVDGNPGDINGDPVVGDDLSSGIDLGDVAVGESLEVTFEVQAVDAPADGLELWQIFPLWEYEYVSCVGERPLLEPHSTSPVVIDFNEPEGGGSEDDGADESDGGLDDTGGDEDDSDSADAGEDEDSADAGAEEDGADADAGADETGDGGIPGDTAGGGSTSDGDGCGCRSSNRGAGWFALFGVPVLFRRRRA